MPAFVASIEVYFNADDLAAAAKFADAMSDAVADFDADNDLRITAVTSGAALAGGFDDMRSY